MKNRLSHRNSLTVLLLLTIAGVHYLDSPIASLYAIQEQPYAAKAWEYILTNAGLVVVLGCVGIMSRVWYAWPVIAWGMVEGGERVACRLARPIGGEVPVVELFSGMCGSEYYYLGILTAAALAAFVAYKTKGATCQNQ